VAARSKAWTILARLDTGVVGSNPTQDMDVCVHLFCFFFLFCVWVEALRQADPQQRDVEP
jgi:hypothetical protein